MVKITDITSDGGSNGGDPNKKPQEEEDNQNDQPQEEEDNQNEQQQQQQQVVNLPIRQQNLRIPEDLPNEINELILLLLERCDYPSLLCTFRAFRDIITSPEFFERCSRLGRTEHVLYALSGFLQFVFPRWHILHRRNNSLRLSLINSLPQQQQQVENLPNLPYELIEVIFARIPRDRYPSLLKAFRGSRLELSITLPKLFQTRSRLGRTECVLYASIGDLHDLLSRWHILHLRNNSLRLSMIKSLPPMLRGSAVVTIGHDLYMIGGKLNPYLPLSTVIVIDCRLHKWRPLPDMRRARQHAAAGVIDGKIYVVGGCTKQDEDWVEVFDVKTQIWETVPGKTPDIASLHGHFDAYVVLKGAICIWDGLHCLAYKPGQRPWKYCGVLNPRWDLFPGSCCVVDDILYSLNPMCSLVYPAAVVYDPRIVICRPVKGIQSSVLKNLDYRETKMANFGGKLVIMGKSQSRNQRERGVWCIVIALERRENAEIWGNVESNSRVHSSLEFPIVVLSPTVTV